MARKMQWAVLLWLQVVRALVVVPPTRTLVLSPRRRHTRIQVAPSTTEHRPPYALSGLPRPKLRGAVMGYLHRSRLWYWLASAYVVGAVALLNPKTLLDSMLRVSLASASSLSVLISDGYHNPDRRSGVTEESELFWLRWDYIGISAILTTNFWLWAANLRWVPHLLECGVVAGLAMAAVATTAFTVVPKRSGHIAVKLTLAFQFVGLLGYLVTKALSSSIPLCSLIYFCYLPGYVRFSSFSSPSSQLRPLRHEMAPHKDLWLPRILPCQRSPRPPRLHGL